MNTDPGTVTRVLRTLRNESQASRVVLTGGDPLMPYDNHLEVALRQATTLGFEVNLHTNGLLLAERYPKIREHVSLYSLAIDGPDAEAADWFRGQGYFERFQRNVELLAGDGQRLAFNTFTSPASVVRLPELAEMIAGIAARTDVEYWLISQYRPIGRPNARKKEIYGHDRDEFTPVVDEVRRIVPHVEVFAQPTRAPDDPYPFRVWVLGDGTVTADLGSVAAPRNAVLGNLLYDGFAALVRRAIELRHSQHATARAGA